MFFIGMMSIKEDIRAAYAAPKIETTEVRLETGIAQSPAFGGRLRRGGRLRPGSRTDVQFKNDFRGEESMKRQLLFLAAGAVALLASCTGSEPGASAGGMRTIEMTIVP